MKISIAILLFLLATSAFAAVQGSAMGKIIATQGHRNPACREVFFKDNATGFETVFRIPDVANSDIGAVALTALMGNRNVIIAYDPNVTTGCGSEPAISYITIYK